MQILLSFFRILLRKYIDFAVLRRNLLNELTGIQFYNYVQGNIACKLHDFPCLHLVINLLITKGLFYHTFHIHLSASLSYIIRSNYGIFKLEKLWVCVCVCVCVCAQSCPTLCSAMECSLPGSSVYGISRARILEWAAI